MAETIPGSIVARNQVDISVTPTVSLSAYATGDAMGSTMTFANAVIDGTNSGVILSASLVDKDKEALAIDLVLFKTAPATPPVDNEAFAPTDADLAGNYIMTINFATWDSFSVNAVSDVTIIGKGFKLIPGNTDIYGVLVARGVHDLGGTSDLVVELNIQQN